MKQRLLQYLACPECGGAVSVDAIESDAGEILAGEISCAACALKWPVVRGVPRFAALSEVAADKAATAENFGWQWNHFTQEDEKYGAQFLGWLQPLRREFFAGKTILEGGCGKGRHTALAAGWGAQDVVGIDLSVAVEAAFAATRHLPNAHIVQADIFKLPLKKAFDYAFSIGVLHHTPDPKRAFLSLAGRVKSGGHISAWIYGAENNEWITRFVNPVRENVTSRLPQGALLHLSKIPAAALFAATKLIYAPANALAPALANHLFYNDYLNHLATFGWREQHNIVFDHLVAPTAFYISKADFETWWRDINAQDVAITWHNKNSWCGFGATV